MLGLLLGGFVIHAYWLNTVNEDAYITYRFARALAEGRGFVWNVDEAPVEGFTSFLWVVLCAAAYRAGLDLPLFAQWLGLFAGLVTLIYTYRFAKSVLQLSQSAALFTTALLAAAGPLAFWATSGMETVFFGMWALLAVFHASRFASSLAARDVVIASMCLLLATLTRPEGFGLFGIVFIIALAGWPLVDRTAGRHGLLLLLGTWLPLFILYFVWRYQTFGYLLPNTFYAKTGGTSYQYFRGMLYTGYFTLHFVVPIAAWFMLCAWTFSQSDKHTRLPHETWARLTDSIRRNFAAWMCGGVVVLYVPYIIFVGGDYMAMYRFFVPLLQMIYALVGLAMHYTLSASKPTPGRRLVVASVAVLSLGGVVIQSTPFEQVIFADVPGVHGTYRGVKVERWHVNRLRLIGEFFDKRKLTENDSLFTNAIGLTGYVSRMKIHDQHGLVDPRIAHTRAQVRGLGRRMAGHEKQDLTYSFSRRPTFVMFTRVLTPQPTLRPIYPPDIEALVKAEYRLESVWMEDRANRESGYFTYLAVKRGGSHPPQGIVTPEW